jgi:hypothetical protein
LFFIALDVIFSAINKAVNGLMGSEKPVPDEVRLADTIAMVC